MPHSPKIIYPPNWVVGPSASHSKRGYSSFLPDGHRAAGVHMNDQGGRDTPEAGVLRRRFLLRAIGAGSIALALPTIVTVTPADASQLTSPPPQPPPNPPPNPPLQPPAQPPTEVEPATEPRSPSNNPAQTAQVAGASVGRLPFTGIDVEKPVAAGLAAIAGGSAMVYWSADHSRPIPDTAVGPDPPAG